jgi:hypothetical protein
MNQLTTLEPRQAPITPEDFQKLEAVIEKSFDLRPVYKSIRRPVADDNGNVYRWEHDVEEVGLSLSQKTEADQRLLDAMRRPATAQIIAYHLTRLSAHKRNTKGGTAFQVIVEDLKRDLDGVSEWALVKAYEDLRKEEGDFFPSANHIAERVKYYQGALENINPQSKTLVIPRETKKPRDRTFKQKRRVSRLIKTGMKMKSTWSLWEKRFMKAYQKHTVDA